jgi:hypothetical protein
VAGPGNPFDTIANFVKGIGSDGEQIGTPPEKKDDAQMLSDIEELYKKARDDRRQYESEWFTNLAFLKGQQNVRWSKSRQTLYLPPTPPWRKREVVNLVQPIFKTILGKLVSQRAQAKVGAANATTEAQQDAMAQDDLLDYLWDVCDSEAEYQEAEKWAIITGTGINYFYWDKSLGDEVNNPDTVEGPPDEMGQPTQQPHPQAGQPMRELGADGQPNPEGNTVHMGQIDHIAVSPFQFFPEPMVNKIADMEWCFYVSVRPASYVLRKFNVKLEEEQVVSDDFLQFNTSGDDGVGVNTKGIVVKEFRRRPTAEHPEGQYFVYAQTHVLVNQPNPYDKAPIPFVEVKDGVVPGRFWGRSVISDLVPLQRAYNRNESQMSEIREGIARPKWHVFKGALDPGKTISTAPHEVLVTNPIAGVADGGKPSKIVGGDVPASFVQAGASMQSKFFEIAGIHDFSKGLQGLGGARAGYIIQMLLEEDGTRMGVLKGSSDRAVVQGEKIKLQLAKQFYIEPRTIKVVGPDQSAEVKEFYAEKIPDDVDVRIIASGALPTTWAAKQQFLLELRDKGMFANPRGERVFAKLMGLADVPGMYENLTTDTRQAQRENELMKAGQQIVAHDYDNHLIHGDEHDDYRKSEEYEQLVLTNQNVAAIFVAHTESHKQLVAAAMQGQVVPPKIQLSAKLTPQQEVQAFGETTGQGQPPAPAAAPAPFKRQGGPVAQVLASASQPKGPIDLQKF